MTDFDKILESIRKIEERLSAIEARLNTVVVPRNWRVPHDLRKPS